LKRYGWCSSIPESRSAELATTRRADVRPWQIIARLEGGADGGKRRGSATLLRSLDEADHLRAIFAAAEAYRDAHPPESPEVIAERRAAHARLEEWGEGG
jgi:hypothetical protein